jgi:esterase/lipase
MFRQSQILTQRGCISEEIPSQVWDNQAVLRVLVLIQSLALVWSISGCCVHPRFAHHQENEPSELRLTTARPVRGVVLVVHGLNQRPSSLEPLASEFRAMGYHSYRLTLAGHEHEGVQVFDQSLWEQQLVGAYQSLREQARALPVYVLGYSLGGLLVTRVLDSNPEIQPTGVILLAPALSLRLLPQSAYLLTILPPVSLSVPNVAPPLYRRFASTPLFWYRNTINLYEETRILSQSSRLSTIPTLIIANPRDELVSFTGLESWLKDNQLSDHWSLEAIRPAGIDPHIPGHVIIDSRSLGKTEWERLLRIIRKVVVGT